MKRRRLIIVAACCAVLLTTCFWTYHDRVGQSATAAAAKVGGLPPDATDIRWVLRGPFGPSEAYEFSTTERGFQQWVEDHDQLNLTGPHRGRFVIMVGDEQGRFLNKEIPDAIAYSWREEDRGIAFVFDRATARAYFHSHSR